MVDGLKREYEGKVEFRLLNVEEDQAGVDLANSMGITAVPTFVFINSNGVQAGKQIGSMSREALQAQLDRLN